MSESSSVVTPPDRRAFLAALAGAGISGGLLPGVLYAQVAAGADVTPETIKAAEELAGVSFDEDERKGLVDRLKQQLAQIEQLHKVTLDNAVAPALVFAPTTGSAPAAPSRGPLIKVTASRRAKAARPADLESLAFASVAELSALVRQRVVTSRELTEMYLARLKRLDPQLKCVVNLTEERARRQADAADREIAAGRWRGPLHGLPWGAKDLLATKGYPTTWGAGPYRDQVIDLDADVVRALDEAGAVLIAKLTLGELAQGDSWFGGVTKNPWKLDQGSSGSSAGPASATAAGCVAFSIGSETLGSISSPSTRCGATGLRPTFGRVPRGGAMALSWTMDKLGPICRTAEDCALVLAAIIEPRHSTDAWYRSAPFTWDAATSLRGIRIGYMPDGFASTAPADEKLRRVNPQTGAFDDAALGVLRRLGADLVPVTLPDSAYDAMRLILTAEAAAAFDELTRTNRDKQLVNQRPFDWPTTFRLARFIPAVDYINANRVRTLALEAWNRLFTTVDVIVTPTSYGPPSQLVATNLTGHPALIVPNGFREDGTPVSLSFLAGLFDESRLCTVAHAYQQATDFHLKHPELKA
jgi:Asp-tRNA(Asn)/Glu-tRNA(Gln) amidotransferase A subunit family amidase